MRKGGLERRVWIGSALLLIAAVAFPAQAGFVDRLWESLSGGATLADNSRAEEEAQEAQRRAGADGAPDWSMAWRPGWRSKDLVIPSAYREKSSYSADRRIDPALQALMETQRSKGSGLVSTGAKGLGVGVLDQGVLVRLVSDNPREGRRLEADVRTIGGTVTGHFGAALLARVPASALGKLVELRGLAYAVPQAMYAPAYENILNLDYLRGSESEEDHPPLSRAGYLVSEGVSVTGADRLHAEGITGKGVRIGIIDFGYQRYDELQAAGEVPVPAGVRAFNRSGAMASDTVHGTACAEIVHDMAPDASLYLAVVDGADDQLINAAHWLAEQGVDIISFSGGGHGHGPHNGKAFLDRFIDDHSRSTGIAWIVAAGNEGDSHWLGRTVDTNRDGLIDVDNPSVSEDVLLLEAQRDAAFHLSVYWDDWGSNPDRPSATIDVDAHLFVLDGPEPSLVSSSTGPQDGAGRRPREYLAGKLAAGFYALVLDAKRVDSGVNLHVVVESEGGTVRLHPLEPAGSIAVPATATEAFAVGAVDVRSGEGEPFSSRGPTDDGRTKPEVVAPDHTKSAAYAAPGQGFGRFPGTSAACPHAAGLAALLKQVEPSLSRADLLDELVAQVRPIGEPVPNNRFGFGHVDVNQADPNPADTPDGGEGGRSDFVDRLRRVFGETGG